jgi:hypothetical protein
MGEITVEYTPKDRTVNPEYNPLYGYQPKPYTMKWLPGHLAVSHLEDRLPEYGMRLKSAEIGERRVKLVIEGENFAVINGEKEPRKLEDRFFHVAYHLVPNLFQYDLKEVHR